MKYSYQIDSRSWDHKNPINKPQYSHAILQTISIHFPRDLDKRVLQKILELIIHEGNSQ